MYFTQVSETDWMDSATQAKAAEKADQMLQLIGYPDWLTDASQVQNKLTVLETTLTKVDGYYLTAPATSEQDHFMNMISTGHWAAIQDLKTLRWQNLWFTISIAISTMTTTTTFTSIKITTSSMMISCKYSLGRSPSETFG